MLKCTWKSYFRCQQPEQLNKVNWAWVTFYFFAYEHLKITIGKLTTDFWLAKCFLFLFYYEEKNWIYVFLYAFSKEWSH